MKNPFPVLFPHWQRSLFALIILSLIGFLIEAWHWAHEANQFPIKNIQIEGSLNFVSPETIENTVSPYVTQGFFNIPISKIQNSLLALPGITQVSVTRNFPNTLHIIITEDTPVAIYNRDSFVDTAGHIVTPELLTNTQNLPIFMGPVDQMPKMVTTYQAFAQVLNSQDQLSIYSLKLDPLGQWELVLNNKIMISCGNQDPLDKLKHFAKAYPNLISQNPKQILVSADLRYPTGLALRWN